MINPAIDQTVLDALIAWYDSHRPAPERDPERSVAAVGLIVTEHMRRYFPLADGDYITPRNQVRKQSKRTIQRILSGYGEDRIYLAEGGRTTRSSVSTARSLADRLNSVPELSVLTEDERNDIVDVLQRWLVDRVQDYFNRLRITVEIDAAKPGPQLVESILAAANDRGSAGAVAQHLVGAKLAIRYPHIQIENHSFTTADLQLGRSGDFQVGDTIFHVTVSPTPGHLEKCVSNVRNGYRSLILVPTIAEAAARFMADQHELGERLWVTSIESFVGQNIEELSEFGKSAFSTNLRKLLDVYNSRVDAVETDKTLLIEIPENLT